MTCSGFNPKKGGWIFQASHKLLQIGSISTSLWIKPYETYTPWRLNHVTWEWHTSSRTSPWNLKPETCHAWNPGIKGRSCSNSGVSRKRHLPAAPRHMEPQHPQSSHVTEGRNCKIMQLDLPKGLRTCSQKTNLIESIIWTYWYISLTTQLQVYLCWQIAWLLQTTKNRPRDCAEDSWLIPQNTVWYNILWKLQYWIYL